MKSIGLMAIAGGLVLLGCEQQHGFKVERVSRTSVITLNDSVEKVFPLFGAFEERKVDADWDPVLIFPEVERIELGTTFKTLNKHGNGQQEEEYTWQVALYEPAGYKIRYVVFTANRVWTVDVFASAVDDSHSGVAVTYAYTGLNELGNELNRKAIELMFKNDLKDWEEAFNFYLRNGTAINARK